MENRLLLALQFWEGDKDRAMALARFLADLEPEKVQLADFLFMSRFDCKVDEAVVHHVARKFNTRSLVSRRRGIGWPIGCNELWLSVMEWITSMTKARKIPRYKAVFTFEADGAPICRDWITRLSLEWERVNQEKQVVIAGALVDPGPHINGNALVSCRWPFLEWVCRHMTSRATTAGWDYAFARDFQKLGWADIPGIKSLYNSPTFSEEQYQDMQKNQWVWVHGGKDTSLIKMGRARFKV